MTGPVPIGIMAAAQWIADHWEEAHRAPSLAGMIRKQFGLNLDQSIKAIAQAQRIREDRP